MKRALGYPLAGLGLALLIASCATVPGMSPQLRIAQNLGAKALPETAVMVGAGDIAYEGEGAELTAKILDTVPGTVFALGDNAYQEGSLEQFQRFYEPTWGRHKARTRPAIGNHEYRTPQAAGYFTYFGAAAGPADKGYYAYDVSAHWRAVVINSNEVESGGVGPDSAQYKWLAAELAASAGRNVVAYWHHPRFSTGHHGDHAHMQPIWQLAVSQGVDVVLAGHDHDYERFHPINAAGQLDQAQGLRSFVVGTGGKNHYPFLSFARKTTANRDAWTYGALKLTLEPKSYRWEFLAEPGKKFRDAGESAVR